MVAKGHGVVAHRVQSGPHGGAVGEVGVGRTLVDVAAVQQQDIGVVLAGAGVGNGLGDIGHAVLEGVLVSTGDIGDKAVYIRGLKDLNGVPAGVVGLAGFRGRLPRVLRVRREAGGRQAQGHDHRQQQGEELVPLSHVVGSS